MNCKLELNHNLWCCNFSWILLWIALIVAIIMGLEKWLNVVSHICIRCFMIPKIFMKCIQKYELQCCYRLCSFVLHLLTNNEISALDLTKKLNLWLWNVQNTILIMWTLIQVTIWECMLDWHTYFHGAIEV